MGEQQGPGREPRRVAVAGAPAWNRLKPTKYDVAGCTPKCSLSEDSLGPELFKTVHGWYEQGCNQYEIGRRSDQVGHHLSYGAIARHKRRHLVELETIGALDPLRDEEVPEKVDHIKVLERIIAIGAQKLPVSKVSPEITLKAMELHLKHTQGRALDDTFAAISAAMAQAGGEGPVEPADTGEENRAAVKTPAELAEELAAVG